VKPQITTDLLRGLLVAYASYECYMFIIVFPSFVRYQRYHSDTTAVSIVAIVAAALPIAAYLFVLLALLACRAARTAFALVFVLSGLEFLGTLSGLAHQSLARRSVIQLLLPLSGIVVAYCYCRGLRTLQRSNQTL
jgi:hypothetical protein